MKKLFIFLAALAFLIVSCSITNQSPAQVVRNYLEALVAKDQTKLVSYTCKNWENEAQKELDSFMNVGTSLENVDCQLKSQSNSDATVICNGSIKLTYDTEIQTIDLGKRVYELSLENNEWRVCSLK